MPENQHENNKITSKKLTEEARRKRMNRLRRAGKPTRDAGDGRAEGERPGKERREGNGNWRKNRAPGVECEPRSGNNTEISPSCGASARGIPRWELRPGWERRVERGKGKGSTHRRSTPPSSDALRHSGGERRRCTSATVTLYLDVELRRESRPGTEQKTSVGEAMPEMTMSLPPSGLRIPAVDGKHRHQIQWWATV